MLMRFPVFPRKICRQLIQMTVRGTVADQWPVSLLLERSTETSKHFMRKDCCRDSFNSSFHMRHRFWTKALPMQVI